MKKIPLLFCFVLFFTASILAQENQTATCPSVTVSIEERVEPGKPVWFTAHVKDYDLRGLSFHWSITTGEILEGQGTSTIKVLKKMITENLTATVEVKGCPKAAETAPLKQILFAIALF